MQDQALSRESKIVFAIRMSMPHRNALVLIFGVIYSLMSTPLVRAGAPIGGNLVIFDDPEEEVYPAVAYNPDRGEYLVVWHNDRPAHDDIRARLLSEGGTPLGGAFYIAGGPGNERRFPDVVYNSREKQYLVVWVRTDCIYGRRVSDDGQVLGGSATKIVCVGLSGWSMGKPALAYASTPGHYLVVWSEGYMLNISGTFGMILSNNGNPDSTVIHISDEKTAGPDVAYNRSRNEFLVTWMQLNTLNPSQTDFDIYARRVRGDGTPMQPKSIEIVTGGIGTKYQGNPVVGCIPTETHQGHFLIVWEDQWQYDDIDLWGRRVDGEGNPVEAKFPITVEEGNQQSPALAGKESSRNYLLVWSHQEPGMLNAFIRGREINIDGSLLGEERKLGIFSFDNPGVASGAMDYLVVYDDIMPFSSSFGIFGSLWGNRILLPLVQR